MSTTETEPMEILELMVEARGEVISSNVTEYRSVIREWLANVNRSPETDDEFGQATLDVKRLKEVEDAVKAAKEKALSDTEDLKALLDELDSTDEEVRQARLDLEKIIKSKTEEVKGAIIEEGLARFESEGFPAGRRAFSRAVADALKGKRTLDSMRKAVDTQVTIHLACLRKSREAIESFIRAHGPDMVRDQDDLELKPFETVEVEIKRRFDLARAEAARKAAAEEAKKAQAEADILRKNAEQAKQPAGPLPFDLPEPPKVGSIPVGRKAQEPPAQPAGPSESEEWGLWLESCRTTFLELKAKRESLTHARNQECAQAFADALNGAWKSMRAQWTGGAQ